MFLSEDENRKLTQVGPGTPGGELLRRYWHPIVGLHQPGPRIPARSMRGMHYQLARHEGRNEAARHSLECTLAGRGLLREAFLP